MYAFSRRSKDKLAKRDALLEAAERKRLHALEKHSLKTPATSSLSEHLLPFLLAAMETCWMDAVFLCLVGFNLFETKEPLMPFWAPFVLIVAAYWCSRRIEKRMPSSADTSGDEHNSEHSSRHPHSFRKRLLLPLFGVTMLVVIWASVYSQSAFLLDPRWFVTLFNDILSLNERFFQICCVIVVALYCCWRGIRLTQRDIEPSDIFSVLRTGLIIIIVALVVISEQVSVGVAFRGEVTMLLLIPVFLFLALAGHALARITFVRRFHPFGLEGSINLQERATLLLIGLVGLLLLFSAWLVDSLVNPALLVDIQRLLAPLSIAYNWLIQSFAQLVIWLVTPIYWFLVYTHFVYHWPISPSVISRDPYGRLLIINHNPQVNPAILLALKIGLPLLLLGLMFLLLRRAWRRRHKQILLMQKEEEFYESLWSWSLFWTQLTMFCHALFERFFPRRQVKGAEAPREEIKGEPTVRSVREIYRALLQKAATHGYPRKKDETPYEFEQRLDENVPLIQPQLAELTTVYAATRYGGAVPDEAELVRVRGVWSEIERKWE